MLQHPDQLDAIYHALADGGRRAMVDRLARGPATVTELAAPLDMTLSAVVQHLKVLEASGLIRTEKVGRVRTCQVNAAALSLAEKWVNERRMFWERRLDRLGDVLASLPDDDSSKKGE